MTRSKSAASLGRMRPVLGKLLSQTAPTPINGSFRENQDGQGHKKSELDGVVLQKRHRDGGAESQTLGKCEYKERQPTQYKRTPLVE
jgi:hypothetical protein